MNDKARLAELVKELAVVRGKVTPVSYTHLRAHETLS